MLVDVKTNTISLSVHPEDYKVYYYIESHEYQQKNLLVALLNGLLTFEVDSKGNYITSIVDLFILSKILEKNNNTYQLKFTELALTVCTEYIQQRVQAHEIKKGAWNDRVKTTLKHEPFEDQKPAIAFMLARLLAGNFSSVGIGKTLSALGCFNILKNQNKVSTGIVFCLNENKLNWTNELKKHTNYTFKIVGNGTKVVLNDIENFKEDLLVLHYDCLLNDEVLKAIIQQGFDFWICDEAHILRNYGKKKLNKNTRVYEPVCQRANAVFQLQDAIKPHYVFPLTGTPIPENPLHAYAILKLLCPNNIPNRTRFEEHFCNFIKIPMKRGSKIKIKVLNKKDPYKNLDQLAFMMELYSFRMTQDEVKGFPPTIISVNEVQLEDDQQKMYDKIQDETFREIAKNPEKAMNLQVAMVKTLRLRQFLSHPMLIGENKVSSIKFKVLDQIVGEILDDPKQKVIIFSAFRPCLELLTQKYKDEYGAVLYAGVGTDLKSDERDFNIQMFLNDPNTRMLVANTAISVGSNWGQVARYGIYMDIPPTRLMLKQSAGRLQRRDAVGTSNLIFLLGHGTVDLMLWNAINAKNTLSDNIIGQDQEVTIEVQDIIKTN